MLATTAFRHLETVPNGSSDGLTHLVINGENALVLEELAPTHAGAVDLIYIDPPYDTGNQSWIYNDKRDDWTDFFESRLRLAYPLMKDTAVIFVAIGDARHHHARFALDRVFGAQNFISNIVWQGGKKNDSRYVSNGADYMLVYAKNERAMAAAGIRWREPKEGVDEIIAAGHAAWERTGDAVEATKLLREWFKSIPPTHPSKRGGRATTNFKFVDGTARPGSVYFDSSLAWPSGSSPYVYDVIHPITQKPVRVPKTGWRCTEDRMREYLADDRIHFGADETGLAYLKLYLDEACDVVPTSVFEVERRAGSRHLEKLLGDKRFPYPKDHSVLMRWIRMAAPTDAVVLDFFGGSGTTAEAVMRLNSEDGGTRQAILVTNNELSAADSKRLTAAGHAPGNLEWESLGVFAHVTRPRLTTLVTGVRPNGSAYPDAVAANVEFHDAHRTPNPHALSTTA